MIPALLVAGAATAATPAPPPEVIQATWQFYLDAWPQPGPDEDPADYPAPLPATADAKTVRGWLKTGVVRPVKVTPGQGQDWLIDSSRMDIGNYYCGTGGCVTQIWTQYPGHSAKIFDQQIRELHFRWLGKGRSKTTGYTWMEPDFHGSYCGKTGNEACPWGFEWRDDGRGHYGFYSSWRFAHGEVIHPGPPPQAVDPMIDPAGSGVPQMIVDKVARDETACKASGAATFSSEGVVNRLPDINGDGIDDWAYEGAVASCNFPEPDPEQDPPATEIDHGDPCAVIACDSLIWLSRRDGVTTQWDRLPFEVGYALRYKAGKVSLVQLDNPPGVKDDDPAACDTYAIDNCVLTPIPLSPKPQ